jgi:hypothetical protein
MLAEREPATVVPARVHAGSRRSRDVAGRAGHEQRARRPDPQSLERQAVRLGPGLVRAGGLGGHDRVEADAEARSCALPELFGAGGDDAVA